MLDLVHDGTDGAKLSADRRNVVALRGRLLGFCHGLVQEREINAQILLRRCFAQICQDALEPLGERALAPQVAAR